MELSLLDKLKQVDLLLTQAYIILFLNDMKELADEVLSTMTSVADMADNIYEVKCL